MNQLSILSRDADTYAQLIESAGLPDLAVCEIHHHAVDSTIRSECNILLADPDLGAKSLTTYPKIVWLQSTWAGVRPLLTLQKSDFKITGIKDVFGVQMREYVFAYLLYFSRQIELFQSLKHEKKWQPLECNTLNGKTLCIFGLGSIGKEVAKTAKHFGMNVLAVSHSSRDNQFVDQYILTYELSNFAEKMDYVVLLLPDTLATRKIVNKAFLDALPAHCVLVNAGRGQVIDEAALIDVLKNKQIKAAVLDVFNQEPLPSDNPLWQVDNCFITQHTSAISQPQSIVKKFIENYLLFHQDKALLSEIDREKGY